ncbi:MAG TPA: FAD-binding oxidoreductase [Gammaproteobacteria bacterium]|nr:FAD-binding oxidoreductase [Gammaproteobacteria bacterium]
MTTDKNNQLEILCGKCPQLEMLRASSDLQFYGQDASKHLTPNPTAILLPNRTEEVQQIVQWANEHDIKLVPSGGRTGLSGGAVAAQAEVVISLEKMNHIIGFNTTDRTVTCQAGVVTAKLQEYACAQQLYYPVDFASSGSSQIGGNIATNAGGIRVLRYGLTRDWVSGLTVITGSGERLDLNQGLIKNATGYDLRHLMIGSEGTLGIITEAKMQLTEPPVPQGVTLCALDNFADCLTILRTFRHRLRLSAFEFFSDKALNHVLQHNDLEAPFQQRSPYYLLAEYDYGSPGTQEALEQVFEECFNQGWISDGIVAQSETQSQKLWQLRERVSESISNKTPYKNDISVCPSQAPIFLKELEQLVNQAYPDYEIIWFGHIGDGNVHLNILKPETLSHSEFLHQCHQVSQLVGATLHKHQGSVSAEHGVGLLKKEQLRYSRSEHEISLMKQLKLIFDPKQILNPGKIFDI